MGMACYALYVFIWRASSIAKKRATQFDDRYGPLAVCGAVVVALIAIFLITCIDFYEVLTEEEAAAPPPPALAGGAGAAAGGALLSSVSAAAAGAVSAFNALR